MEIIYLLKNANASEGLFDFRLLFSGPRSHTILHLKTQTLVKVLDFSRTIFASPDATGLIAARTFSFFCLDTKERKKEKIKNKKSPPAFCSASAPARFGILKIL